MCQRLLEVHTVNFSKRFSTKEFLQGPGSWLNPKNCSVKCGLCPSNDAVTLINFLEHLLCTSYCAGRHCPSSPIHST